MLDYTSRSYHVLSMIKYMYNSKQLPCLWEKGEQGSGGQQNVAAPTMQIICVNDSKNPNCDLQATGELKTHYINI